MLITCQKFRSRMTGHYSTLCHVTMCNTQNVGPKLFACNENHAYIMPCVTACAVTSCAHRTVHAHRQASHPYVNMVYQKLLKDMPFMPAEHYLSKITTSHFSTLNMKIANQNVLKRILIAMHNEMRPIPMRTSGYVQRNP